MKRIFFLKRFNEKKLKMLNEILKRYMAGAHVISHKVFAYIYIYIYIDFNILISNIIK